MCEIKVSIIIATYNGTKTLPKAVESLLAQTIDSYEIILSDDCSTDETRKLIEEYVKTHPDIVVANYMETNTRGSGAYNAALKKARGKYVAFIDQDDWVDKTMYEKLYEIAEKENADVADCIMHDVDSNGHFIRISDNTTIDECGIVSEEKRKKLFLAPGSRLPKIFRKDFLLNNNIYHCENVCYGDPYMMELVAAYCSMISKLEEPLYFYRTDMESTTKSYNNPVTYDRVKSAELMIKVLEERGFLGKYREEIEFRFIELFYVNSIYVFLSKFRPCDIKEIKHLRDTVKQKYNNYRKNKYFKERITYRKKIITLLCDISPSLLCKVYTYYHKLKEIILHNHL